MVHPATVAATDKVRSWAGLAADVGGDGSSFCAMTVLISVKEPRQVTPFVELLSIRFVAIHYCLPVDKTTMNKKILALQI